MAALRAALEEGNEERGLFVMRTLSRYQGPIPPASEVRAWEEAAKGSAGRILRLAETNQTQTFELNKIMIDREGNIRLAGVIGALIALLAMLAVTAYAIYEKQPVLAGTFGVLTIISVVAMFLRRQATVKSAGSEVDIGGSD